MSHTPSPRHNSPVRPIITIDKLDGGLPGGFITPPLSGKRVASSAGSSFNSGLPFPNLEKAIPTDAYPELLSPPLSPPPAVFSPAFRKQRVESLGKRVGAKNGLKIKVNESTLRQYTDYDNLGTPRTPFFSPRPLPFSPVPWTGNTFGEPDIQTSLERMEDDTTTTLPILDVFATKTVRGVVRDTAAAERLRHFADMSGRSNDIDFLLQVGEYDQSLNLVVASINNVSAKFTGVAATTPVRLPLAVGRNLNGDMREASNTLLPNLECLFDEAKIIVEQSLAKGVYPDFLKHQISSSIQANCRDISSNLGKQACYGFGEAFCMTDPREPGNPMIYASTGLADLTGYAMKDLIHKSCRIFQGPATRGSCLDRIRDGLSQTDEFNELVLNYTRNGSMYWCLLFIARLTGVDGEIKYHLGGQLDVTEMLKQEDDLMEVLSHVPPFMERRPTATGNPDEQDQQTPWRGGPRERRPEREQKSQSKYPPNASRNNFLKNIKRRYSRSPSECSESRDPTNDSVSGDKAMLGEGLPSIVTPSLAPTRCASIVSPYSRYMVLEFVRPTRHQARVLLPLTFCSAATLDCFAGGKHTVAEVLGLDVFEVLSEKAGASITKPLKANIRDCVAKGKNATVEITLGASRRKRQAGISISRRPSLSGTGSKPPSIHGRSLRKSFSLDRLMQSYSAPEGPLPEDYMTHWAPLENGSGAPRWVVVILVPLAV